MSVVGFEEIADRQPEPRQHVSAVEKIIQPENDKLAGARVDPDGLRLGLDDPGQLAACGEILFSLRAISGLVLLLLTTSTTRSPAIGAIGRCHVLATA